MEYTKLSFDDADLRRGLHTIHDYYGREAADMQRIDQRFMVNSVVDDLAWNKWVEQEARYFNLNRRANDAYLSRFDVTNDLSGKFGGRGKLDDVSRLSKKLAKDVSVLPYSDLPTMMEDYAVGIGITHANTFNGIFDEKTGKFVRIGRDFGWYDPENESELDKIVRTSHGNRKQRPYNYTKNEDVSLAAFGPNHAIMESILNDIDADVLENFDPKVPIRTSTSGTSTSGNTSTTSTTRSVEKPMRLLIAPAENGLELEQGPTPIRNPASALRIHGGRSSMYEQPKYSMTQEITESADMHLPARLSSKGVRDSNMFHGRRFPDKPSLWMKHWKHMLWLVVLILLVSILAVL